MVGLLDVSFLNVDTNDSQDETGSELKKRKRMLALQNGEKSFAADGDEGNDVIGTTVSFGGYVKMNVISNPCFDEKDVTAGSDDQACLGKRV